MSVLSLPGLNGNPEYKLVDFDRADELTKSSEVFVFLSLLYYHRVACTRERPQTHPRHRVPPPHGTVDLRMRLEKREDRLAKTSTE